MMESLFRLTDLETRISLNLNVLSQGVVPRVMGLGEVLNEWLAHRREVLVRRSEVPARQDPPPPRGARRLPDRLPQPRRGHPHHPDRGRAEAGADEALQALRRPGRGDPQHAPPQPSASSRRCEIRGEHDKLTKEGNALKALLKSEDKQWAAIAEEIKAVRKTFGPDTPPRPAPHQRSARRPEHGAEDIQTAMVEREPITVVVSEKGWIRALERPCRPTPPPSPSRATTR